MPEPGAPSPLALKRPSTGSGSLLASRAMSRFTLCVLVLASAVTLLAQTPDARRAPAAVNFGRPTDPTLGLTGKALPASALRTLTGDTLTTADLRGKPTLVNLWFIECQPCIDELPVLNKLRNRFGDRVHFVAITHHSGAEVERFLARTPFDFTQVVEGEAYLDCLGATFYPRNLFVDRDGVVRRVEMGVPMGFDGQGNPELGDGAEFAEILEALLDG